MPTIVYWDSDGVEKRHDVGAEPVLLGRAAECAIRSEDPRVSRRHARITASGADCWIEDLNSANGVYVGTMKVTQARLPPGEIVVVGSILLQLQPEPGQQAVTLSGTYAQLSVWLKLEREEHVAERVTLVQERDALAQRVAELHDQLRAGLSDLAGGGGNADAAFSMRIERLQAELEGDKEREIAALRAQLGSERQTALESLRDESEGRMRELEEQKRVLEEKWLEAVRNNDELSRRCQMLDSEIGNLRHGSEAGEQAQRKARQLWNELRAARQEVKQLEDVVAERDQRLAVAETDKHVLQAELGEMGQRLGEEHARAAQAAREIQELQHELEALRVHTAELRVHGDRVHATSSELEALRQENEVQSARAAELQVEVESLRAQLREGAETLAAADSDRTDMHRKLQEAAEKLVYLRRSVGLLQTQVTEYEKERGALAAERDELAQVKDALSAELSSLQKERSSADSHTQRRLSEVEAAYREVQAGREALTAELLQAKLNLGQVVEERDTLQRALDSLEREQDDVAEERERVAEELQRLGGEHERLVNEHKRLVIEHERLVGERDAEKASSVAELARLREERERLEAELRAQRDRADKAEADRDIGGERTRELDRQLEALQAKLDAANAELDGLRNVGARLTAANETNAKLVAMIERLRAQNSASSDVSAKLADVSAESRRLLAENENLRGEVHRLDTALRAVQTELTDVRGELGDLRANGRAEDRRALADAADAAAVRDERAQEMQAELGRLKDANAALSAELDAFRQRAGALDTRTAELDTALREREEALARIAELSDKVTALTKELTEARAERARLSTSPGSSSGAGPGASSGRSLGKISEHVMGLRDAIAALRVNIRVASDETAVMPGDSESVQVVTGAISEATENIERARDSIRSLTQLLGGD